MPHFMCSTTSGLLAIGKRRRGAHRKASHWAPLLLGLALWIHGYGFCVCVCGVPKKEVESGKTEGG